ncbi:MAG: hypothetical protein AAF824_06685 [Bacteroidota bacterium]
MSKDPFDIFKEGLQDYHPKEIPSWLSWEENAEAIQAALPNPNSKKRRPFWLFLCLLLMGFVGLGSVYLLTSKRSSQEKANTPEVNEHPSSLSLPSTVESSKDQPIEDEATEENISLGSSPLSSPPVLLTLLPDDRVGEKSASISPSSPVETTNFIPTLQPLSVEAPFLLAPTGNIIPVKPWHTSIDLPNTQYWSLHLSGGATIFQPNYVLSSPEQDPASFEEELIGWSAALRMSRVLKSRLSLSTGVEIQRLRYLFKLDESFQVNLFRPNTPDTILINRTRRDTSIIFTDTIPGTRRILARQYNSHFRIAIPLLIGYQLTTPKWTQTLRAGPQFQLYRNSQGYTIIEEEGMVNIGKREAEEVGIILGLQAEYESGIEIAADWMILTQIGIQKSLGKWAYETEAGLSQKPLILYGRIGIGKRF